MERTRFTGHGILAAAAAMMAVVLCSFLLSGCKAIEGITRSKNIYYHSDCHPDIWTTQIPEKATDNCNWTLVESQ